MSVFMVDQKQALKTCPDCGQALQFGSGCHFCPVCGFSPCKGLVRTVIAFVVMVACLAMMVMI